MTSDVILTAVESHLRPLVVAQSGVLDLSETPQDTLSRLKAGPARWRCILQWLREDAVGEMRGAVDLRILVVVQQSKGLDVKPGRDVQTTRAGDSALLARWHQVCSWVRGLRLQHPQIDCRGWHLGSAYWLFDPDFPTRQIAGEFSLVYGLGPIDLAEVVVPERWGTEEGDAMVTEEGDPLTWEPE